MELLSALGIDWHMLVAQMINYGILLVALTVLLYRPILKVIDERRERVEQSVENAKALEQRLKTLEQERQKHMKEIDEKATVLLAEAKQQADTSKQEILAGAQHEVDVLLERGHKQLEDERRRMVADLEATVARVSVNLAGKILEREFSPTDQQRLLTNLQKDIPALLR